MSASNSLVVTVAHDYICPWCWVGLFQSRRLEKEFPQITLDWRGYELLPKEIFDAPLFEPKERDPHRPLGRFELFAQTEGVPYNPYRSIGFVYSHNALEGAEFAKTIGKPEFDLYNEGVYRAYWEGYRDISNMEILTEIAKTAGLNQKDFTDSVIERRFNNLIVPFDDAAYAADITHVPTFLFRGERVAEAPYAIIRNCTERFLIWYDKQS